MRKHILLSAVAGAAIAAVAAVGAQSQERPLGFFVTSTMHSGNLGGLAGADAECQRLAAAVGAGNRTWRAYLSTQGAQREPAVNARDRIGDGPWFNSEGIMVAPSLADLHGDVQRDANLVNVRTALTEAGNLVNGFGRAEGTPQEHDMLTGSDSHGRAFPVSAGACLHPHPLHAYWFGFATRVRMVGLFRAVWPMIGPAIIGLPTVRTHMQ